MTVIGIVEGEVIDKIELLSDNYMLFYKEGDLEENIRAVNHLKYVEFFDLDKGTKIKLKDIFDYQVVNSSRGIIFNEKEKVNDEAIVVRYAALDHILNQHRVDLSNINLN